MSTRAYIDRRPRGAEFYDDATLRGMYARMSIRQISEQAAKDGHGRASYGFVRFRLIAAGIELRQRGGARVHTRKFGERKTSG